jgi:ParB-like chromosome segregation protein Spo0J
MNEINVDKLIPYINNARTHSEEQINQIALSIKEFGFRAPILIGKNNTIIAGHGRVLAAKKIGLETIPYIDCSDMTEIQTKAYILADNRIALNAGWDYELLALEVKGLAEANLDMQLLGFSDKELAEYLGNAEEEITPILQDEQKNLLMIECITENELQELFDEMNERGFQCKILN